MRDLPRSIFATPGVVGIGNAKTVGQDDEDFAGMQIVHSTRSMQLAIGVPQHQIPPFWREEVFVQLVDRCSRHRT